MKNRLIPAVLALFFASNCAFAQSTANATGIQDSLSKLSSKIWKQKTDSSRLQANAVFFKEFQSALETSSSTGITLDSIAGITRIASEDGKIQIFTWNVPLSDGTNKYFGFIQNNLNSSVVIQLQSNTNNQAGFDSKQFTPQEWYGAIYYKLIEVEINNQKAYTLLGWDGFTANSNRKFIDIYYPDKNGNIVFGMPVFKTDKGIKTRVVLEYAEKANMLLRYDYQSIMVEKKKKLKKEDAWLIVMDRMVPMDTSMEGIRKYYVPTGDTYDGYIFRNGFWTLVENIEVANKLNLTK
ncbi:MAG: hypothetical protein Q7U54_15070 [Bacteroidales bacterium]|nr:hypothetical protein [Bacteroidales bacterium]